MQNWLKFMNITLKKINIRISKTFLIGLIITGIVAAFAILGIKISKTEAADFATEANNQNLLLSLATIQENSLLAVSNPYQPLKAVLKLEMVITAYSSTTWQTDEDPFITASGSGVKDGVVANNFLPFGTKVRIPEIYGDKVFVVEDRMHWRKSNYHLDIWFSDYWQAKNFGAKTTYVEILES